jgi:hypothetical protein
MPLEPKEPERPYANASPYNRRAVRAQFFTPPPQEITDQPVLWANPHKIPAAVMHVPQSAVKTILHKQYVVLFRQRIQSSSPSHP